MKRFIGFLILAAVVALSLTGLAVVAQDAEQAPAEVPAAAPAEAPAAVEAEVAAPAPEAPAVAAPDEDAPPPAIEAAIIERVSYAIGMKLGMDMKNEGENLDPKAVVQAIEDVIAGKEPKFAPMELEQAYRVYAEARQRQQMDEINRQGRANRAAGDKYLAENKLKEGVVTLESGVQYKVIKEGEGPLPKATDFVMMNYTGRLIDGTQFASSHDPRVPAQAVSVQNLFPGLIEAVTRMPVGSTWEITLPPETAIGDNPGGPGGPNSVFIFTIEILEITAAPEGVPGLDGEAAVPEAAPAPNAEGAAHVHGEDCNH